MAAIASADALRPPPGFSVYVLPMAAIDSAGVLPVPLPIRCGSYSPWLNQPQFCELACKARDADVRRFPADAPAAQPAELRRASTDEERMLA